ncbi:tail assembly chaperone [Streptococcus parauberis]|uniref:tail assembly chaperone n=1 Tax=Streptococcus parauberis TaxID=1348 RepID=UPI000E30684D|nr:tail assembly chaperone [Streptococcus parauberis]RFE01071.1 Phage protein [Streptococcus parauberis]
MQFLVGKKEHELEFGVGFIRNIDEKYYIADGGMKFGQGVTKATIGLLDENLPVLVDTIQAAIPANISEKQIEAALGVYAEEHDGDFEPLFKEVLEGLKGSSFTKGKVIKIETRIKEAQAEAEAKMNSN